jgi:hypothetical protein
MHTCIIPRFSPSLSPPPPSVGLDLLTNIQRGHVYGDVSGWSLPRRRQLGVHFLHKAYHSYRLHTPQQIYQTDLWLYYRYFVLLHFTFYKNSPFYSLSHLNITRDRPFMIVVNFLSYIDVFTILKCYYNETLDPLPNGNFFILRWHVQRQLLVR